MTRLASMTAAAMLLASPAYAVTVENGSADEIKIGVDYGNKEEVKTVAPEKSIKFDCPDGCGVTRPWGFSWMAQGDDSISTNGKSLVTVAES